MIRTSRKVLMLAMAGSLFACSSPDPETPPPAAPPAAANSEEPVAEVAEPGSHLALVPACNIELIEPNAVEWNTHWDPRYTRDMSQHPSGVRSAHWATESEAASLERAKRAFPLEVSCGSDAGSEYSILIEMVAAASGRTDIPLETGSYPIVPMTAAVKPGEIVVGNLQFNGSGFDARSGNVTLERFDTEGAAGNFLIEGREKGGENRPIRIEGTFDMPCRFGQMQGACTSTKAERE